MIVGILLTSVCTYAMPPLEVAPPDAGQQEIVETHSRRYGLMSGGLVMFSLAYVADAGVTYGFHHDPSGISLIPLLGPLIQCGDKYGYQGPAVTTGNAAIDKQMNDQIAQASTLISTVTYVGLVLDFAAQAAGITMAIVGAATHRTELRAGRKRQLAFTGRGLGVQF